VSNKIGAKSKGMREDSRKTVKSKCQELRSHGHHQIDNVKLLQSKIKLIDPTTHRIPEKGSEEDKKGVCEGD
jgi:hypothetical protein